MSGRNSGPLIRLDRGGGKRCLDVALSVPLLLVLSAPMLLVALLVKLDSLFRFKAGFSKHRARFSTARLVLDIDTTARLDATWQEAHTMAAVDPKYFPGYRQIPRAA